MDRKNKLENNISGLNKFISSRRNQVGWLGCKSSGAAASEHLFNVITGKIIIKMR